MFLLRKRILEMSFGPATTFLAPRGPRNLVNYDTKRLRLAKYLVNYSVRPPLGGSWGPFGRDLGACRRNFDGFKLTIQNRWKRLIYISECDTRTVAHGGPSWAVLGPILGARGPILGPFWASLGPSRAISKVQKPIRSDKTENA